MCLLIVKPAGADLQRDWLINGAKGNANGSGAAWVKEDGMFYARGIFNDDAFADFALENIKPEHPGIIHFRLATHGTKDNSNCHPFDLVGGWMMAHNGIISGLEHPTLSDTALYAQIIIQRLREDPGYLDKRESEQQMADECIGSKLAFIHRSGRFVIVNEQLGDWEDGVWFSNNGHKPAQYLSHYDWEEWKDYRAQLGYRRPDRRMDPLLCSECYTPLTDTAEMDAYDEPICNACYYWLMQAK